MPMISTCPDHPGVTMTNVQEELAHARSDHAEAAVAAVAMARFRTEFVSQAVAQGNVHRRRFACRRCGTMVDTTDPDRPPFCTSCGVA